MAKKKSVDSQCNRCWMGGMWTREQIWTNATIRNTNLPQLRRAPIVKVLYKQANIGFAAEAVFFEGGGKGAFRPKKGCNAPFAG